MDINTDKQNALFWDMNISVRVQDIISGNDITYNTVVIPYIKQEVKQLVCSSDTILDIGCGSGILTNILAKSCKVIGLDISPESIAFCKKSYPNISFICKSIFQYHPKVLFDTCFAVLVLHCMEDLSKFYHSVNLLLRTGGSLLIVIPHPCFWPYHKIESFINYSSAEKYILPFRIKNNHHYPSNMLYFHRTLSEYINRAAQNDLHIEKIEELFEKGRSKSDLISLIFRKH